MSRFDDAAKTWDDEPKLARARTVADLLRATLPLKGVERVLDLGAGTGQLSLNLADAVGEIVVSDASKGMVEVASRNIMDAGLAEKMSALQLDLTTQDTDLAPFDGVWSMLAFHHVPDMQRLLSRVQELLHPGGWLAVVDLDQDPDGAFHAHVGDDFEGHHGFARDSFREQLEAAGFEEVRIQDAGQVDKELEVHGGHSQAFPMFLAVATRS
ncbi:class I SAM-dependent methyltransferase [Tessaracoccus rhinocerotis]|uniref:Class I SAM-dependent methyltransferase n=1 Tax=Tessaracoccus rhinocerotis TaxID=1689449 RepID=A0A553JYX2_9ACTN|nr:class I SAM-dependent methyltransferase [Tessaracoccus rhinocerotis]TRY17651.1 class I SAM-dependent methyltransferase [Tessaracoccus rhinocerotis]